METVDAFCRLSGIKAMFPMISRMTNFGLGTHLTGDGLRVADNPHNTRIEVFWVGVTFRALPPHTSKHIGYQRFDTRLVSGIFVGKTAQKEPFLLVQFYPKPYR